MLKKIITISLFLIISIAGTQFASAQRAIDPSLKPQNLPATEKTGLNKEECINQAWNEEEKTCFGIEMTKEECENMVWDENSQMCQGPTEEPITAFLQVLGGALLMLAGGIAVIIMAYGGIQYVISQGNQERLDKAKKTLLYGVIGIVVVTFSYFIVSFVLRLIIGAA